MIIMGLDQYAYSREKRERDENTVDGEAFYWRKHSKLQEFMEDLALERDGITPSELNCSEIELHAEEVRTLMELVKGNALPRSRGGFFYGHQFQDESAEEYREQDIQFCKWALEEIAEGDYVFYGCDW